MTDRNYQVIDAEAGTLENVVDLGVSQVSGMGVEQAPNLVASLSRVKMISAVSLGGARLIRGYAAAPDSGRTPSQ